MGGLKNESPSCGIAGWIVIAQESSHQLRLLVICVDGVGYDLVKDMHSKGELKHLLPPAPVINAFPSLTNPALVEILQSRGAPPARGYEDLFFDPARNRMAGGLLYRLSHKKFIATTYSSSRQHDG
jgi:hypothetical protein